MTSPKTSTLPETGAPPSDLPAAAPRHVDVVIVGAGWSGISACSTTSSTTALPSATPSSRGVSAWAARGTCSATRASAPIRTCTRWAPAGRGCGRSCRTCIWTTSRGRDTCCRSRPPIGWRRSCGGGGSGRCARGYRRLVTGHVALQARDPSARGRYYSARGSSPSDSRSPRSLKRPELRLLRTSDSRPRNGTGNPST